MERIHGIEVLLSWHNKGKLYVTTLIYYITGITVM